MGFTVTSAQKKLFRTEAYQEICHSDAPEVSEQVKAFIVASEHISPIREQIR